MQPRFIKVRKDNRNHDRGFIAVDAICSVFENGESHNVSIMTMDGFWYDVEDDVEKLYNLISGEDCGNREGEPIQNAKKEYFRHKRMMPASTENDRPNQNQDERERPEKEQNGTVEEGEKTKKEGKKRFPYLKRKSVSNLPAGAGEGQHNSNPRGNEV